METKKQNHNFHDSLRRAERHAADQKATAPPRSSMLPSPSFLNQVFQPVICGEHLLENWQAKERKFFRSLGYLARHYNFKTKDVSQMPFPLNVYYATRHAASFIKKKAPGCQLVIAERGRRQGCLAVVELFDIGNTLYFIPLRPLYNMLQQNDSANFSILVPIFRYLSKIVRFPSYLQNDAISWFYRSLLENVHEEYETKEERESAHKELKAAFEHGHEIMKVINQSPCLSEWGTQLDKYEDQHSPLWKLSSEFMELYQRYPRNKICQNIHPAFIDPQEDDRAWPDQYLSFVWEEDGPNVDQLETYMSDCIMECGVIEVPLKITFFDRHSPEPLCNFDFEDKLFNLLGQLASILYKQS